MLYNNARTKNVGTYGASDTSIIVTTGEGALFPTTFPFDLTWEHYESGVVTKREIITVTNIVGDLLTITRTAETCVQDESANPKVRSNNAYSFVDGDFISQYVTEDDYNGIHTELDTNIPADLALKLDISTYNNEKNVFGASSVGTDAYKITDTSTTAYTDGRVYRIKCDVANTDSATLEINSLGAKALKKNQGQNALVTGDILANGIVTAVYNSTLDVFQFVGQEATVVSSGGGSKFGGDGGDGSISGALTVTGSNDTYIVKNYEDFIPGNNTVTITPTNCLLHIKVSGNCDLTNTTFSFSGKGGQGGTGGAGETADAGNDAQNGTDGSLPITNFFNGTTAKGGDGNNGANGAGGAGGIIFKDIITTFMQSGKKIEIMGGNGGGGGGGGAFGSAAGGLGGNGGNGGGTIILEVKGNLTFSSTSINMAGTNGSAGESRTNLGGGGGGGGGGAGGMFICLYNGVLTGSNIPVVSAGSGGGGGSGSFSNGGHGGGGGYSGATNGTNGSNNSGATGGAGGAGATGLYLIEKNTAF